MLLVFSFFFWNFAPAPAPTTPPVPAKTTVPVEKRQQNSMQSSYFMIAQIVPDGGRAVRSKKCGAFPSEKRQNLKNGLAIRGLLASETHRVQQFLLIGR